MRTEIRNPLSPVVRRAAALGKAPGARSRESGASRGRSTSIPATSITSLGVDGDGNDITLHDFLLGADTLGDPAVLRVSGNVKNYGS